MRQQQVMCFHHILNALSSDRKKDEELLKSSSSFLAIYT
jgi:hypothetical protein